ncbi:unnamed protein product [Mytilus coruscus]|uniref:Uncharacterized protein n=1 Tax=Mytilus coruscus TaxID=42192 RepID=A0A6J8BY73_MYTCO|nr:unnamed protein product [Mytilus coruscus]
MHNQSINSMALVSARIKAEVTEILQMMTDNLLLLTVQGVDLRHIRNLVLKEIDMLVQEYPDKESTLNKILCYELLFSSEKMAAKVADTRPVEEQLGVKQQISDKMSALYRLACNGGIDASKQMGKG